VTAGLSHQFAEVLERFGGVIRPLGRLDAGEEPE
jgi:hypothetical protein